MGPPEPARCQHLQQFILAQDVCHAAEATASTPEMPRTTSRAPLFLAGFQLITLGRFWVLAEAKRDLDEVPLQLRDYTLSSEISGCVSAGIEGVVGTKVEGSLRGTVGEGFSTP